MFRTRARDFLTLLALGLLAGSASAQLPTFAVSFDPGIRDKAYSGRVYLFVSKNNPKPASGPSWFDPEPFLSKEVVDWEPGESITLSFDDPEARVFTTTDGLPDSLAGYRVQAVARFNDWARAVGSGLGNGVSKTVEINGDESKIALTINNINVRTPFQETKWGKLLKVRSEELSDFHNRDVYFKASVRLPASYYEHPSRRYPVILRIPGFGGDHRLVGRHEFIDPVEEPVSEDNAAGVEFIRVLLNPNFPTGHHVFADSANNGPVGTAFIKEFIPVLDQQFRTIAEPSGRFLTGHSSGGWSSLWLQITYPEMFGGVWSTAPDPVDFRDFQGANLYQPGTNMWFDKNGDPRPLARNHGKVLITYQPFDKMEQVLGHGGQLQSFEAVFGPRGADGKPVPLWSRETGDINPEVADYWRRYDINHTLKTNWKTLGPKLQGKIHVFMGTKDTFYLEGATRNLKETLADLGSDAVIELVPGANHFTLLTEELKSRILAGMTAAFLADHPAWPGQ